VRDVKCMYVGKGDVQVLRLPRISYYRHSHEQLSLNVGYTLQTLIEMIMHVKYIITQ
jgi:hypothetical protein